MFRKNGIAMFMVVALAVVATVALAEAPPDLPIEQSFSSSVMNWTPGFDHNGATLVITGRDGLVARHEFGPVGQLSYDLRDASGLPLADGVYTWQLTVHRTLSGAEEAALKAAEDEAARLRTAATSLRRTAIVQDLQDDQLAQAEPKLGEPVDAQQLAAAEVAAQVAEANIELVQEQLELKSGRFAELRTGRFTVTGGTVEFSEDEYALRALKAAADTMEDVESVEASGQVGPDLGGGEVTAGGPGLKDFTDAGDIKAGGGLAAGSTTTNPGTGDLYLIGAGTDILMDDPATNTNDWLFDRSTTFLEFESPANFFNAITYEASPVADVIWIAANANVGFRENAPLENIHITDPVPGVRLEDTTDSTHAMLRYNAGHMVIEGNTDQNIVEVNGTAPGASLYIENSGQVGLGTTSPVQSLHVANGGQLFLDSSGADWWLNPGGIGLWFIQSGVSTPVKFQNGAQTDSLVVASTGDLGIQGSPTAATLHVRESDSAIHGRVLTRLEGSNFEPQFEYTNATTGKTWRLGSNPSGQFVINQTDDLGVAEMLITPDGVVRPAAADAREDRGARAVHHRPARADRVAAGDHRRAAAAERGRARRDRGAQGRRAAARSRAAVTAVARPSGARRFSPARRERPSG